MITTTTTNQLSTNNNQVFKSTKLKLNDIVIESREDGFINATQMCKAGGKKFNDWKRKDGTQELIKELKQQILKTGNTPIKNDKPTAIIARTVKGKGISFAENVCGYHGICPKDGIRGQESLETALIDIGSKKYTMQKALKMLEIADHYQKDVDKKPA